MLQSGVLHSCACVELSTKGVSQHFGGVLASLERYRAVWCMAAIVSESAGGVKQVTPSGGGDHIIC